ncbi:hypothetical protein H6F44_09795 [Pseudanabaena sp. FACHB-1277]|uniref:Uncharacterized protein n=1 Tax=Pseudanabaena cinerea FACHB-1277 TaxID=2949581 RepID=A0A926Z676_9CYAN|nr:CRISPR-associated protein Csx18 [Pseudanabaena cinerea]MBD2150408.1 hypothetical protein [Pseudanabaena cinerea FACHB-1277]
MSPSFLKKIVRDRTIITAIANAAVTWIILIIAPLGLFAVITCTLGVFISSVVIGNLSDRALLFLVGSGDRQTLNSQASAPITANDRDPENSLLQDQIKKLLK